MEAKPKLLFSQALSFALDCVQKCPHSMLYDIKCQRFKTASKNNQQQKKVLLLYPFC
jgi:hypothetical protein